MIRRRSVHFDEHGETGTRSAIHDRPARSPLTHVFAAPFILAIQFYRITLSPFLGGHCRYHPTCSRYALEAYRTLNPIAASWFTLRRLLRCHPFGGSGWDPPPSPALHQSALPNPRSDIPSRPD